MRRSTWLPVAVLSASLACVAATRPRYGGTLLVETRAAPAALAAGENMPPLAWLVFEPLVRLDGAGTPQPCLAVSWTHDATQRNWRFTLRRDVHFHDGTPLTGAAVAAALKSQLTGITVAADGDEVAMHAARPRPDMLLELAHNGPIYSATGGLPVGTGPFQAAGFAAGKRARFTANEAYWGGRPYLDTIEVVLGRGLKDQLADLELGKADVMEVEAADVRRAGERSRTVWSSAPDRLMAVVFDGNSPVDRRLREALALSIDRRAMNTVLLQRQAEPTGALLPEWLSGYAFAFPAAQDLTQARAAIASLPPSARSLTLAYDPATHAGRPLAERLAVNARDAGISVQITTQASAAASHLVEMPLPSLDPAEALSALAAAMALAAPPPASTAQALYEAERKLLDGRRVIPLFYLPEFYGVGTRVQLSGGPAIGRLGEWRFADLWVNEKAP